MFNIRSLAFGPIHQYFFMSTVSNVDIDFFVKISLSSNAISSPLNRLHFVPIEEELSRVINTGRDIRDSIWFYS